MGYKCKYGLYHDKPVKNNEPSSNNGWIYTAYANELGIMPINVDQLTRLKRTFQACDEKPGNGILINRLPGKIKPPLSRDEVIGLYSLGMLEYSTLKRNHFVFYGKGEPMNKKTFKKILKGLAQLYVITMLKGKSHRNDFWKYKIKNMYQLAFRLTPADSYWLKKCEGIKPHEEERLIWNLYKKCTLENGSHGEINILWLQAKMMGDKKLAKKCKPEKNIKAYFGPDHIFSKLSLY